MRGHSTSCPECLMTPAHAPSSFWATTVPENKRCQAPLEGCGYRRVTEGWPQPLLSWDEGDLVYSRQP